MKLAPGTRSLVTMLSQGPRKPASTPPNITQEMARGFRAGGTLSAAAKRYWLAKAALAPSRARPRLKSRKLPVQAA